MGTDGKHRGIQVKSLVAIFDIAVARSRGIDDYDSGSTPFVTSAEPNNGVVGYVVPESDDRVFTGPALVVSGLGFATVHVGTFLPKGNGGDSLTILKPKVPMTVENLLSTAAAFNVLHQWRFGFGRKASKGRLSPLEVPYPPFEISNTWKKGDVMLGSVLESLGSKLQTVAAGFTEEEAPGLNEGDATD